MAAEGLQGAGIGESCTFRRTDARAARHVGDIAEWCFVARGDEACGNIFGESKDLTQTEAQRNVPPIPRRQRRYRGRH